MIRSAVVGLLAVLAPAASASAGDTLIEETTLAHGTPQTAQAIDVKTRLRGDIAKPGELDWYAFQGHAGDRVFVATMTAASGPSPAGGTGDTTVRIFDTDGTTQLGADADGGSFNAASSSLAGTFIPHDGVAYVRVEHANAGGTVTPYFLYVAAQSGPPTAETEPNNSVPGQELPASGWVSGDTLPASDVDVFALHLLAGDTVCAIVSHDPEFNGTWNARLTLGSFGGLNVTAEDASTFTTTGEALFTTVKDAGTYPLSIVIANGAGGTYLLSVSVFHGDPAPVTAFRSNISAPIGPSIGTLTSSIAVPGHPRIRNLRVALDLTHAGLSGLDVSLRSPNGNEVLLVARPATNGQTRMDLVFDDDAALPIEAAAVYGGVRVAPVASSRLSWFRGEDAGGTWALKAWNDVAGNAGTLNGWGLEIVEDAAPPCTLEADVRSQDFELTSGGFSHSGTNDQWQRGTPNFAPITTAASGATCWKTNLAGAYAANSSQDLVSPDIDLTNLPGRVELTWSMKYQIQGGGKDHAWVEVREVGGAAAVRRVWEFRDPDMTATVGNPASTLQESAGWGVRHEDISDFKGKTARVVFHLDSDAATQLAGLAIDDFVVKSCVASSKIAGTFFRDDDESGTFEAGEVPLAFAYATLAGNDVFGRPVSATVLTAADGTYSFDGLWPPDANGYAVGFLPSSGLRSTALILGTRGGTTGTNAMTHVAPGDGVDATGYDFGFAEITAGSSGGGDGDLYLTSGSFSVNWAQHAAGQHAVDSMKLAGVLNPHMYATPVTGADVVVLVGGVTVISATLDAAGRSTHTTPSSAKFAVNPRTGAFTFSVSGVDLVHAQNGLGLTDQNLAKGSIAPIGVDVLIVRAAAPAFTLSASGHFGFEVLAKAGVAAKGKFTFSKNATLDGLFMATKLTATEVPGQGHKIAFTGVIVPEGGGGFSLDSPFGDPVTVTVGRAHFSIAKDQLVQTSPPGAPIVATLKPGAVPQLTSFKLDAGKHTVSFATTALADSTIEPAGPGAATQDSLYVRLTVESGIGGFAYSTTSRIFRKSPTATRWSR